MSSFSVIESWHTYGNFFPNRRSKRAHWWFKKSSNFTKINVFLKLNFQGEGHLYAYFSIYILTILSPIRTHQQVKKWSYLLKNVLLKLNFQEKGHLYANCVFYILTFYRKCLFIQFFSFLQCLFSS